MATITIKVSEIRKGDKFRDQWTALETGILPNDHAWVRVQMQDGSIERRHWPSPDTLIEVTRPYPPKV